MVRRPRLGTTNASREYTIRTFRPLRIRRDGQYAPGSQLTCTVSVIGFFGNPDERLAVGEIRAGGNGDRFREVLIEVEELSP